MTTTPSTPPTNPTPPSAKPPAPTTPSRVIVRGGEILSENDHRANLALCLRLENVAVLVGAGASIEAGGRSMSQIWDSISCECKDWLLASHFIVNKAKTPNIEELMSKLLIAEIEADRVNPDPFNLSPEEQEIKANLLYLRQAVVKASMLAGALWVDRTSDDAAIKLDAYRRLIVRLQGSRQPGQASPWVFSVNYDLAVEWSAESLGVHVVNGFTGLHDRRFQPNAFDLSLQNAQASGEARFGSYNLNLVKLHGSLSWRLNAASQPIELASDSIHKDLTSYIDLTSSTVSVNHVLPMLIQPTTAKYVDTVGFVYGELTRRFTEFLSRPNTVLIVSGYSFGDEHINRLLASGLLNPTLQLMIYYPELKGSMDKPDNNFIKQLLSLDLPRITICGGGEDAHFSVMTKDLPNPAMMDDLSPEAKRMLTALARGLILANKKDAS